MSRVLVHWCACGRWCGSLSLSRSMNMTREVTHVPCNTQLNAFSRCGSPIHSERVASRQFFKTAQGGLESVARRFDKSPWIQQSSHQMSHSIMMSSDGYSSATGTAACPMRLLQEICGHAFDYLHFSRFGTSTSRVESIVKSQGRRDFHLVRTPLKSLSDDDRVLSVSSSPISRSP